ncbi:hypothetical protein RHSIM_Rhsim07G0203600 [Rhododendron simsii]|uniref:Uncharacterized protein n=1 Tax=Rhododendron simsii TaxID=118357 RepID=A0A834LKY8_RHOSS|nr:hypothetical protein RHSIM_Rhsim07G0203600 [Rhododendron simsii]
MLTKTTSFSSLPFRFAAISEGLPVPEEGTIQDPFAHCEALSRDTTLPFFKQLVDDLRSSADVPPITCIVCDGLMTFPLKVAKELDVPCALFWTPSACGFLGYSYIRKLVEKGLAPFKVPEEGKLQDRRAYCEALSRDTPLPFFGQLVDNLRSSANVPPITCIVCDGVMSFPLKVAKELDVPCALFWTPSACGFLCYSYFRKLVEKGLTPLKDSCSFRFAAISEGLPVHEEDRLQDALVHCEALSRDSPLPFFRQLVEDLRSSADVPPITCIVCDGVMSFPLKVAKELDVPCALFWTPSACGFLCYSYFRTLVEKGFTPLKGNEQTVPPPLQSHPFISGVDGVGSGVPDIDSAIDVVAWVTWESDQPSKVADPAMKIKGNLDDQAFDATAKLMQKCSQEQWEKTHQKKTQQWNA